MIKRMLLMLITVGIVLGGVFWFINFKGQIIKQVMTAQGEPVQTVSTIPASFQEWLPKLEAVGTLQAVQGVDLTPEVPGIVSEIYFQQGDNVALNAPLLQLRVGDEKAKLAALKATAELSRITYRRAQEQYEVKAISRQNVDVEQANMQVALANVEQQLAIVNKKTVKAPFAGRIGIRQIDLGQNLQDSTVIATLQALDPIFVDFFMPQQSLAQLKIGQTVTLTLDIYPTEKFTGKISVINPRVDVNTRNVQIRASLKNSEHKLLPGMYANVNVGTGAAQHFITVPRSAITFNPFGAAVFLVQSGENQQLLAKQSFVVTGEARGDQIAILEGVKEADTVVTSGQIKLHNGSPIQVNNSVQPSNDPAPQLKDQ
ncbi:MAG: efflux RND transporter periplasmic adaptor subunit [Methylococcaceae bacterium]|jgi:membrane fusion protein (multidrug efflux system)